jgi:malonyl-CoA decarboxylase
VERMNVSFLQELLNTVAERGRALLPRSIFGGGEGADICELAKALLTGRGEASGVAIAREVLGRYRTLDDDGRCRFFLFLANELRPDPNEVRASAEAYLTHPSDEHLAALQAAVESPRRELFRRLNLAPGATAELVALRRDLLGCLKDDRRLAGVDADLAHLFQSWFNRGFLVLRRIDWQTPAAILEKIIRYEAVHAIGSWDDLRRRLDPADRRCYAFFHPSLVDEPLIFVEVALESLMPGEIAPVLGPQDESTDDDKPTVAVFYSISNCREGLKGVSFGSFLLKQVVEDLAREVPSLSTFVTLSPVPNFARWVSGLTYDDKRGLLGVEDRAALRALRHADWPSRYAEDAGLKAALMGLAAHYFLHVKADDGRPLDAVARFHLGNGARLERLNWLADTSEKGMREALGLMVNYRYDLKEIERNHEAYANEAVIAASRQVRGLARPPPPRKVDPDAAINPAGRRPGRPPQRA